MMIVAQLKLLFNQLNLTCAVFVSDLHLLISSF